MQRGLMDGMFSATAGMVAAKWIELVKWAWIADVNIGGPNWELVNLQEPTTRSRRKRARHSTRSPPSGDRT